MIRIGKYQLFALTVIFTIGSTTLFALGIEAKQDAWLVILVSLIIGLGFLWIFTELQKAFPDKNYVEIIIAILGKWIGIPLSLLYAVFWLWPAARNLREFGELFITTFLPNTPLEAVLAIYLATSLIVQLMGFEAFGRTAELLMPIMVFFIISVYFMIFISGEIDLRNLMPVLGNGIMPVIKAALPTVVIFPFCEIFIFSMFWCYVTPKKIIRKTTMAAAILVGLMITITTVIIISVLGVDYTSNATIPFYSVIKLIHVGDIITNLDAIGIIIMFIGGFFKMSLFLNGITLVLTTVFNIKNYKITLVLTGIFLLWVSIVFEPSYIYHLWAAPFDSDIQYKIYLNAIPVLLLMIYWLKKKSELLK